MKGNGKEPESRSEPAVAPAGTTEGETDAASLPGALVVGGGPAAARASIRLADAGCNVTLLAADDWLKPGDGAIRDVPDLLEATRGRNVSLLTGAAITDMKRAGDGLTVSVSQSPRYVDVDLCTACGACVDVCPVKLPDEHGREIKPVRRGGVPTAYAIDKAGMAPCRDACPIDQRAQGYTALIREGDYEAAYRVIKRDNPFPSVCGRVCDHKCEESCSRAQFDTAVSVRALKRFVADWAADNLAPDASIPDLPRADLTGRHVAVVGSGPAGLTCALDLVRAGHRATVYESLPVAGGMMRVGVPDYRLPQEDIDREVEAILAEGVELELNHTIDDVPALLNNGHDAVFVAVGAHGGIRLPIPGAEQPSVVLATDFLRDVALSRSDAARSGDSADTGTQVQGRRVLVLGGGNVAIDAAMTAVRLGADWVGMACLESRETMPAHHWEIRDAEEEGIEVFASRTFKEVTPLPSWEGSSGRPEGEAGVRCVTVDFRGFVDGRPDFDEIEGTEELIAADVVIFAIGQVPQLGPLGSDVALVRGRFVEVDPVTHATNVPGVFAGGDACTGTAFIVDAIAAGRRAAAAIDHRLRGQPVASAAAAAPKAVLSEAEALERAVLRHTEDIPRAELPRRPAGVRRTDFDEVYSGLTEEEAVLEASRCLGCGVCSECLQCVTACPAEAIDHLALQRDLQLAPDVVLWAEEMAPEPWLSLPGVVGVDTGGQQLAVDQALARLGLSPVSATGTAAPAQWRPVNGGALRTGVFLCRCGGEISRTVDLDRVESLLADGPAVCHVEQLDFACHEAGAAKLHDAVSANGLSTSVLAACSCCTLDHLCFSCTTQRARCKDRLGAYSNDRGLNLELVNVREQCAFVHRDDPAAATAKAGDLVLGAVGAAVQRGSSWHPEGADGLFMAPATVSAATHTNGQVALAGTTALVDPVRCRSCEDCQEACGLDAVHVNQVNGSRLAVVDPTKCLGCGVCITACSSGAISATDQDDATVLARLEAMGDLSDKLVVFTCNWGAYSAVEAAGLDRMAYDPSVRVIRLMCAGRAHAGLLMGAFARGAGRVLVAPCGHDGDERHCKYGGGGDLAENEVERARSMLTLLGIDPAKLSYAEMQPGDGARFLRAVVDATAGPRAAEAGESAAREEAAATPQEGL